MAWISFGERPSPITFFGDANKAADSAQEEKECELGCSASRPQWGSSPFHYKESTPRPRPPRLRRPRSGWPVCGGPGCGRLFGKSGSVQELRLSGRLSRDQRPRALRQLLQAGMGSGRPADRSERAFEPQGRLGSGAPDHPADAVHRLAVWRHHHTRRQSHRFGRQPVDDGDCQYRPRQVDAATTVSRSMAGSMLAPTSAAIPTASEAMHRSPTRRTRTRYSSTRP